MKNLFLLSLLSVALTACHSLTPSKSDMISVELGGTPGLEFWGSCTVDGEKQLISGTVPMSFETAGGKFDCIFTKRGVGDLKLVLRKGRKICGEATSTTRAGGVEGRIETGDLLVSGIANGF
jgi:hypothetical protein